MAVLLLLIIIIILIIDKLLMLDLCEVDVALKAYGEMIRSVELHLNRQHHTFYDACCR